MRSHLLSSFRNSKYLVCSRSSTQLVPTIPSNLKIADMKVFEVATPPNIKPLEYLFPTLDVPKSIRVHLFDKPGEYAADEADLSPDIFGVAIRKDIVHECIRYCRHKRRQPKKTKRMSEIRGSNKKPWPQKGLGKAQVGHRRNSVWRGGQKAHGPKLRDYSIGLNRKVRAQGMMIALAAKLREGNLYVFDHLDTMITKTKQMSQLMQAHGLRDSRTLYVDVGRQENFIRSSRNLTRVNYLHQLQTNVYDIIREEKLAISLEALMALQHRLKDQYRHQGRKGVYRRALNEYAEAVKIGKTLPGIPAKLLS